VLAVREVQFELLVCARQLPRITSGYISETTTEDMLMVATLMHTRMAAVKKMVYLMVGCKDRGKPSRWLT
jgi:hypothetical protein